MIFSIFVFGFVVTKNNETDTDITDTNVTASAESRKYKSDMVNMFGEMETDFDWEEGLRKGLENCTFAFSYGPYYMSHIIRYNLYRINILDQLFDPIQILGK